MRFVYGRTSIWGKPWALRWDGSSQDEPKTCPYAHTITGARARAHTRTHSISSSTTLYFRLGTFLTQKLRRSPFQSARPFYLILTYWGKGFPVAHSWPKDIWWAWWWEYRRSIYQASSDRLWSTWFIEGNFHIVGSYNIESYVCYEQNKANLQYPMGSGRMQDS